MAAVDDGARDGVWWPGVEVTPRARCVLAPNPSGMTLDGTNTWVLAEPGARRCVVVDPGPRDAGHTAAVVGHARDRGLEVGLVLVTHRHADHVEGVPDLASATGAPVRTTEGEDALRDGEVVECDGLTLTVRATPGHTSDSVTFVVGGEPTLVVGDTVLGRGTSVVAHPDGVLADYLDSLARLRTLVDELGPGARILPAHGAPVDDPAAVLDAYVAHRHDRLDQVRRAVRAGAGDADAVVDAVYADVDPSVRFASLMSVEAQLTYLRSLGEVG